MDKQHFIYIWLDKTRKMYYIGKHFGYLNDGYRCSSKWLNGEIRYRPDDFKRRIIKFCESEEEATYIERHLLSLIKEHEWGVKYYNLKPGAPKGTVPWSKGKKGFCSDETRRKISEANKGNTKTKGKSNPTAAASGKKGAAKQSSTKKGTKRVIRDGRPRFAYPSDPDYPSD